MIHPSSDVHSHKIGEGTRIWQFCVILANAKIGSNCNVCSHCFIENDVVIGDRVTIKCGVQIWDGIMIEDDVFIGPNVTFTNDPFPRSQQYPDSFSRTTIMQGASIGANATILPGLTIGRGAMIGAGSVVTKDVADHAVVVGNPAQVIRYLTSVASNFGHDDNSSICPASKIDGVGWIRFSTAKDPRGILTVAQWNRHLPFVPQRIFFVSQVPGDQVRGEHAHKECVQILVALSGTVTVVLDNTKIREEFKLASSSQALVIPAGIWASQYRFSSDAVLGVFASHDYDESDYIRDYEQYRRMHEG